jgi:AcrR family transcriptional regulator
LPVVHKVFDATLEQLARAGFERLSVLEVAALAGVNKTTIYRRWPTKSDLVRAAISFSLERTHVAPDTGNLRSDLVEMAHLAANFMKSTQGMGVTRTLLAEGANPDVRELAASILHRVETEAPHAVIRRAIKKGELPPGTDFKYVLHTVCGALIHRIFIEQVHISDAFIDRLVDLVLFGASGGQLSNGRQKKKSK